MNTHMAIKPFALVCGLVLMFACSKSDDKTAGAETPALEKKCRHGACVPGQFQTAYQRFTLVTGDMVNLRSGTSVSSKVVKQLPVTRKVTVLYLKSGEVLIGGAKGRWAYVSDAAEIDVRGWLFDQFLGYAGCFKKADHLRIREIRVILGGKLTVYTCRAGGRFEYNQPDPEQKKKQHRIAGDILQCKNVIWLKKDKPDDYPIFFHLLANGNLELPDQYKDKRGIVITNPL